MEKKAHTNTFVSVILHQLLANHGLNQPRNLHSKIFHRRFWEFPGRGCFFTAKCTRESTPPGHLRCEGVASGTMEITAVAFTACGGWQFFFEMRCGNWTSSRASSVSLVAETGVQKKTLSVSMRKLKLQELSAENCVNFCSLQRRPGKNPLRQRSGNWVLFAPPSCQ